MPFVHLIKVSENSGTAQIPVMRAIGVVLIVSALLSLSACGGSGSSASSNSSLTHLSFSEYNAWGEWSGSYNISGGANNNPVIATTEPNGDALMFDSQGILYSLPELTGQTGPINGTATAYAPIGETFQNGEAQEQFSVSGTISSTFDGNADISDLNTDISGTFSGNNETASFSLTPYDPVGAPISNLELTPDGAGCNSSGETLVFCGNWQGYYAGSGAYAVDLNASTTGDDAYTLSGSDALGCTITGSVNNVRDDDLFDVTLTRTGSGCGGDFTGLGFLANVDFFGLFPGTPGDYFYIVATNGNSGFVAEFIVQ